MGITSPAGPVTRPSRPTVVLTWLVVALGLGGLLAVARGAQGPLDDADPAYQRPGILDIGQLPDPAAMVTPGIPAPGRPAVVFFVRSAQLGGLCDALSRTDLQRDLTSWWS